MPLILKDGSLKEIHLQKIEELVASITDVKLNNKYGCLRLQAIRELYKYSQELMAISMRLCNEAGIEGVHSINSLITIESIIQKTNNFFGVDILKRTRKRKYALARQMCQVLCRIFTIESLKEIGQRTGGYDHTTVIYSIAALNNLIESDKSIANDFNVLLSFFNVQLYKENEVVNPLKELEEAAL